jgi:predicted DCC family thiol-disulfide oxidoreductase YuxK
MDLVESKNKILFYDGECGFCNSSVQFVLKNKKVNDIFFVTLQSKFAQQILNKKGIQIKLDTLYFLKNDKIYSKSSAGLQLTKELKFPYPLFLGFYIIPKFIRDFVYTSIAKRRHNIRSGFCLLPKENEKKYFLSDYSQH